MKLLFLLLMLISVNTFSQKDLNYNITFSKIDQIPQGESEVFYNREGGFFRYFISQGELFDAFVMTNNKAEATEVILVRNDQTNVFTVVDNMLMTPDGVIDMKELKLIAFPEVQLVDFIRDELQNKTEYYAIRMDVLSTYRVVAKKLPIREDGLLPVQITFRWIIPSIAKFIYYYDINKGIAVRKEGFFFSRKPSYVMELDNFTNQN